MRLMRALRAAQPSLQVSRLPTSSRLALFSTSTQRLNSQNNAGASFNDPYPLPLSSKSFAEQDPIPEDLLPDPIPRPNESLDSLRARLNYQSRKRGTLENDLLLSTFAKETLPTMTQAELEDFDKVRVALFHRVMDVSYSAIHSCS